MVRYHLKSYDILGGKNYMVKTNLKKLNMNV